jgi:hypothetical protein
MAIIILLLGAFPLLPSIQAQDRTKFLPTDNFDIPQLDGTINFAVNGSYRSAVFVNNTWIFRGLILNNSQTRGNLQISAQNSKVTIIDYYSNPAYGRSQFLRYTTEGKGIQTINFNINGTTKLDEWMMRFNGIDSMNEKDKWYLQPDDTIVIMGQTGNITAIHYRFNRPDESNLPFHMQHYVAITITAVLVATILVATIITIKTRRQNKCL